MTSWFLVCSVSGKGADGVNTLFFNTAAAVAKGQISDFRIV